MRPRAKHSILNPVSLKRGIRCLTVAVLVTGVSCSPGLHSIKPSSQPQLSLTGEWTWTDLQRRDDLEPVRTDLQVLSGTLSAEEGRWLIRQLHNLSNPVQLQELCQYEQREAAPAGGLREILPLYFDDPASIPTPLTDTGLIRSAAWLTRIHSDIRNRIHDAGRFPLEFGGDTLRCETETATPPVFRLSFDFSAVELLLDFLEADSFCGSGVDSLTNMMIAASAASHDDQTTAWPTIGSVRRTVSADPLDQIWIWLCPWHNQGLADLSGHRVEYRRVVDELRRSAPKLGQLISEQLSPFMPTGFDCRLTIRFSVNSETPVDHNSQGIGVNLICFKDDYEALILALRHETFRWAQRMLCRTRVAATPDTAQLILRDPVNSLEYRDRQFEAVLTMIMLQGTAAFISPSSGDYPPDSDRVKEGWQLLIAIYEALYPVGETEPVHRLIERGSRENGPFGAFGWYLTRRYIALDGSQVVGILLQQGAAHFFNRYIDYYRRTRGLQPYRFPDGLEQTINRLAQR